MMRILGLIFITAVMCFESFSQVANYERPPAIEEALRRHNIQLTRPALVEALRSADSDVRLLAAAKLAQDRATESIAAIQAALRVESVERVRVNMAYSLAQLGQTEGFNVLKGICRDPANRSWNRLLAARYLLDYLKQRDDSCRGALFEILRSKPDPDSFVEAASLLRGFGDLSAKDSQLILDVARTSLSDSRPALRLVASRTLGELGNASAIPYLQSALANEQDKVVRSQIQADLQKLAQKKRP